MNTHEPENVKEAVRERYAEHARTKTSCCPSASCCSPSAAPRLDDYSPQDLAGAPRDADLGLGCGNPLAFESISPGETVVDLGSGGGIDCFLAATRVGAEGTVIGIDMTPEMVALARRNADRAGVANVDFRLGEIEALPVEDGVADLVISNCVINLVPDKRRAFAEAFRVLKPGGRLSVSDIVTTEPLEESVRLSATAYVACLGGALPREEYLAAIETAGFADVRIENEKVYCSSEEEAAELVDAFGVEIPPGVDAARLAMLFRSVTVLATKPAS